MNIIRRLFSGVRTDYLIKIYVIGGVITALLLSTNILGTFSGILWLVVSFILFPFSTIVWDRVMGIMLDGYTISFRIGLMTILWKFFKFFILYVFACLIAPIGILYVLFATRN